MTGTEFTEQFNRPAHQLHERTKTIESICAPQYATTAEERARHACRHLRWLREEAWKLEQAIQAAVPSSIPPLTEGGLDGAV